MAAIAKMLALVLRCAFLGRARLAAENIALRHQLDVLMRQRRLGTDHRGVTAKGASEGKRRNSRGIRLTRVDRLFWALLSRIWSGWRDALVIVQPQTVVKWHRQGFRLLWRWKSRRRGRIGRPEVAPDVIVLIQRMSSANPRWGAPRIHGELRKLGIAVSQSSVSKHMVRPDRRGPGSGQSWAAFLRNHLGQIAAVDFFTVPDIRFKVMYVFVVLSLRRREILHVNVTAHPTAEWTAQQLREAFPWDSAPEYLQRDRDGIYGKAFIECLANMGIAELLSAPRSPWQNGYVERAIGTLRRECTDHIIPLSENHLRRVLLDYVGYYNCWRTHLALGKDTPKPRIVRKGGRVIPVPLVGGLHTCFTRCA